MLFDRDANAGRSGFFKAGKHAEAQTKKAAPGVTQARLLNDSAVKKRVLQNIGRVIGKA